MSIIVPSATTPNKSGDYFVYGAQDVWGTLDTVMYRIYLDRDAILNNVEFQSASPFPNDFGGANYMALIMYKDDKSTNVGTIVAIANMAGWLSKRVELSKGRHILRLGLFSDLAAIVQQPGSDYTGVWSPSLSWNDYILPVGGYSSLMLKVNITL